MADAQALIFAHLAERAEQRLVVERAALDSWLAGEECAHFELYHLHQANMLRQQAAEERQQAGAPTQATWLALREHMRKARMYAARH